MKASSIRLSLPGPDEPVRLNDISEFSIATEPVSSALTAGQHLTATLLLADGQRIPNLHLVVYRIDDGGVVFFFESMDAKTLKALDGLYWDEVSTCITPSFQRSDKHKTRRSQVLLDGTISGLTEKAFMSIRDYAHKYLDDQDIFFYDNKSLTIKGNVTFSGLLEDLFNTIANNIDPGATGRLLIIRENKWEFFVAYFKAQNWIVKRLYEILPEEPQWEMPERD